MRGHRPGPSAHPPACPPRLPATTSMTTRPRKKVLAFPSATRQPQNQQLKKSWHRRMPRPRQRRGERRESGAEFDSNNRKSRASQAGDGRGLSAKPAGTRGHAATHSRSTHARTHALTRRHAHATPRHALWSRFHPAPRTRACVRCFACVAQDSFSGPVGCHRRRRCQEEDDDQSHSTR